MQTQYIEAALVNVGLHRYLTPISAGDRLLTILLVLFRLADSYTKSSQHCQMLVVVHTIYNYLPKPSSLTFISNIVISVINLMVI
jgi:hypothetical protein